MKIAKISHKGNILYGELRDEQVYPIEGDLYGDYSVSNTGIPLCEAKLLAPVDPTKIVCIGKNYTDHIMEMKLQGFQAAEAGLPEQPEMFFKPNSSICDPGDDVVYPADSLRVDYEGEIAVIIGKKCRYVKEEDAMSYIFGLSLLNDVSRRDKPKSATQWTGGKCYDTFCPIGPYITKVDNLKGITLKTYHNGELKQNSTTDYMIFKIPELIAFITSRMTLMPGDIIATGTPSGVDTVHVGDTVRICSDELGELTNQFVEEIRPD